MVRGIGDPARLPAVREGRATPQDQGSQAVVAVLAPAPGERVADVAAAPGGKATAIAERVGASGAVVALDVDAGRVRMIDGVRHRIGLPHLFPTGGRRAPAAAAGGLLRPGAARRAVQRHRRAAPPPRCPLAARTGRAVAELAALQRDLLAAAAPLVRPGGTLVYSVCTLTRAETVGVDDWARTRTCPASRPRPRPGAPWIPHGRGALLLPQAAGTDGMFVLALQRTD